MMIAVLLIWHFFLDKLGMNLFEATMDNGRNPWLC